MRQSKPRNMSGDCKCVGPQFQLSLEVRGKCYGDDVSAVRHDVALAKSRRGTFEWVASHFTEKCSDDQNGESVE